MKSIDDHAYEILQHCRGLLEAALEAAQVEADSSAAFKREYTEAIRDTFDVSKDDVPYTCPDVDKAVEAAFEKLREELLGRMHHYGNEAPLAKELERIVQRFENHADLTDWGL